MPNELTPKQEKFCQKYVELGNASEAYRQAYDAGNMSNEAIKVEACRLLQSPNISLTVLELQEEHRERHKVTVHSITQELEEARLLAIQNTQCSAAVSASMGKAKIHGYDKTVLSNDPDNPLAPSSVSLTVTPDLVKSIVQQVRDEF